MLNLSQDELQEFASILMQASTPQKEKESLMADEDNETKEFAVVNASAAKGLWATYKGRYWTPADIEEGGLPPGVYTVGSSQRIGVFLDAHHMIMDDLMNLPGHGIQEIVGEIINFWNKGDIYKALGYVHKRGILMYGPPGSGKTSILQLLVKNIVEQQGGIVLVTPDISSIAAGLSLIRAREPNRPILCLLEDVDGMASGGGGAHLLSLLDGEAQVDKVVFVATTNYLSKLPDRLVCRPSRFDLVVEIGMPNFDARFAYLRAHTPASLPDAEISEWAERTADMSVAFLKELILLKLAYELTTDDAIERLVKIKQRELQPGKLASIKTVAAGAQTSVVKEDPDLEEAA